MNDRQLKMRWLLHGGIGAVLIGTGLCLTLEVSHWKQVGATTLEWVVAGTISLSIFMAGISFIANAVRYRIRMDKSKGLF
jgi:hypothetical protein